MKDRRILVSTFLENFPRQPVNVGLATLMGVSSRMKRSICVHGSWSSDGASAEWVREGSLHYIKNTRRHSNDAATSFKTYSAPASDFSQPHV
uniref:Uncharacterized protein n=1 Tax=Physcomitrium patens TaxID=3218 RepID=A0A7I4D5V0_PHYPA